MYNRGQNWQFSAVFDVGFRIMDANATDVEPNNSYPGKGENIFLVHLMKLFYVSSRSKRESTVN